MFLRFGVCACALGVRRRYVAFDNLMCCCEEHRAAVEHVVTDDPSKAQWDEFHNVLPNLQSLSLDPMHIVFLYEARSAPDMLAAHMLGTAIATDESVCS